MGRDMIKRKDIRKIKKDMKDFKEKKKKIIQEC
jgi:hypothetical protein